MKFDKIYCSSLRRRLNSTENIEAESCHFLRGKIKAVKLAEFVLRMVEVLPAALPPDPIADFKISEKNMRLAKSKSESAGEEKSPTFAT